MPIMQSANPRHIKVFKDKGSLNHIQDITVNTIAPMAKPKRREGHFSPLKYITKYPTDLIKSNEIGTPSRDVRK